jgi:hypothetical protein
MNNINQTSIENILTGVNSLPMDLHACGTMSDDVLNAFVKHTKGLNIEHSVETGSGKTTILLSNISKHHTVFSIDFGDSIGVVRRSPLFNSSTTVFVEGPTQKTIPNYNFEHKLQFVLIDGPHGYPFPEIEYYFLYPHIDTGGLLVVDDVHLPTINNFFDFLREDEMFDFIEVVDTTAFFRRNSSPLFDPYGDGWWLQGYNKNRAPLDKLGEFTTNWREKYPDSIQLIGKGDDIKSDYIKIRRNHPYLKALKPLLPLFLKRKIIDILS